MHKVLLFIFLQLTLLHIWALTPTADSLLQILDKQSGTTHTETLIELSNTWVYANPQRALDYANQALESAPAKVHPALFHKALKARGYANGYLGNTIQSISDMQKGLDYYKTIGDSIKVAEAISDIGYLTEVQGNYPEALRMYQHSLEIRQKIGDKKGIAYSLNNIGALYWRLEKTNEALDNYQQAIAYFEKSGLKEEQAITLGNMGVIFSNLKQYEQALKYNNQALALNRELGNTIYEATNLNNIGKILVAQNKTDIAIDHFRKAIGMQLNISDRDGLALSHYNLGCALSRKGDVEESNRHLAQCEELCKQTKRIHLQANALKKLSENYATIRQYDEAYKLLIESKTLEDSIFTEEKNRQIEELKTKYETQKHTAENEQLKHLNDTNQLIIKQKETQFILSLALAALLLLSVWLLFQKRRSVEIRKTVELEQKLLRSQMNPHFIFNTITVIQSFIMQNSPRIAVNYLSSFASLMRLILENSNREFIPFEKELETTKFYLELQQQRFSDRFEYQIDIDPQLNQANCYSVPPMVAQPFIENAIEHGFKNSPNKGIIKIHYQLNNNQLIYIIEDNGIGIQNAAQNKDRKHRSFGMEITKHRVQILAKKYKQNFDVKITDKQEENSTGTRIQINLPIQKNDNCE